VTNEYHPEQEITQAKPSPGNGRCPDSLSRAGAERLAGIIRDFWHSRGKTQVDAVVVPMKLAPKAKARGGTTIWTVEIRGLERGMPVAKEQMHGR